MRASLLLAVLADATFFSSIAYADSAGGEIHRYCADAQAIVIGSCKEITGELSERTAEFAVSEWVYSSAPDTTTRPAVLRLTDDSPWADSTFMELRNPGRHLVFVFSGNRTGRLGSIVPIAADETVKPSFLYCLNPQPTTLSELTAQIRRVLSPEYRQLLIGTLQNDQAVSSERTAAARHLGTLRAAEAAPALETLVGAPAADGLLSIRPAALRAIFDIDAERGASLALHVVATDEQLAMVRTAAQILTLHPARNPQTPAILVAAGRRWENYDPATGDSPLPEMLIAIAAFDLVTPDVEALVLKQIQASDRYIAGAAMSVAGGLEITAAVPLIWDHLASETTQPEDRSLGALGLAGLAKPGFEAFADVREMSAAEARAAAAEIAPQWEAALADAPTQEVCRGDRLIRVTRLGETRYYLAGWQREFGRDTPRPRALLLHRTPAAPMTSAGASGAAR